jgi:hypothetical protein
VLFVPDAKEYDLDFLLPRLGAFGDPKDEPPRAAA